MAPRHARDEQPREVWPVNEPRDQSAVVSRNESRPATVAREAAPASVGTREAEPATVGTREAEPATVGAGPAAGGVDFSTYVNETIDREGGGRYGREPVAIDDEARDGARLTGRTRADERAAFERVGLGTVYRGGEITAPDAAVLGLDYTMVASRMPVRDDRWAGSLRQFARSAVWALPAAVLLLGLSSAVGWPTTTVEPKLLSPGGWVVVTALGLGLWLLGVTAMAALNATSRGRVWGVLAVATTALGVALLGPVVGAVGLARPAITRAANAVSDDQNIANAAGRMQDGLLNHLAGRFLLLGGAVLLALGAIALIGTILGNRVLQRHDAILIAVGVLVAIAAAALAWSFLLTLAAMVILAGVLGLAYTASRIAPDGTPPPAY